MIKVHGHRGARARRPENTLAAFSYAIEAGVDAVELDVLVTKDGVPVVLHDPVVGGCAIRSLTLDELREREWGAAVPTLDEVFALGTGNSVWFNTEVKSFTDRPEVTPEPEPYADLVLDRVRRHGIEKRVILQSFDARITRSVAERKPDLRRSALWETDRDWAGVVREFEVNMLSPLHELVTREKVAWAHAAGFEVATWTVNRPEDWARMAEAGVDAMITDDPAALIAWLQREGLR